MGEAPCAGSCGSILAAAPGEAMLSAGPWCRRCECAESVGLIDGRAWLDRELELRLEPALQVDGADELNVGSRCPGSELILRSKSSVCFELGLVLDDQLRRASCMYEYGIAMALAAGPKAAARMCAVVGVAALVAASAAAALALVVVVGKVQLGMKVGIMVGPIASVLLWSWKLQHVAGEDLRSRASVKNWVL